MYVLIVSSVPDHPGSEIIWFQGSGYEMINPFFDETLKDLFKMYLKSEQINPSLLRNTLEI